MSKWVNIDDICIPSDENDWHELVAFADAVAEQEPIDLVTCAECRHCTPDIVVERRVSGYERSINLCKHPRLHIELAVDKDWYCADGQRKEKCKECWYWSEAHKRCENKGDCQFKPYGERRE